VPVQCHWSPPLLTSYQCTTEYQQQSCHRLCHIDVTPCRSRKQLKSGTGSCLSARSCHDLDSSTVAPASVGQLRAFKAYVLMYSLTKCVLYCACS
jgi:hypothetical protein